ncbi:PH domain-containing protein [Nocardioides sp.]|uniref:PH domain-containing protein n=1 Tax=Nocardioides sp. TaxID=35761 RepID=UPI002D808CF3|nr:PH domain-containing protein [Nocardioides sp.]HET8961759.1 PH domain-containing protein [Nocardioides sp.]
MTTPPAGLVAEGEWQRLDRRMLLVHPIREVLRFLPVLVGLFVFGRASGGSDVRWQLLGIAVPVALGILRYFTTSFRIGGGRIELRRGLVNKHLLSTRLERVRTVEMTAQPIQRLLGLTTVRVGTGTASTSGEDQLDLDGLPTDRARRLRAELLHAAPLDGEEQTVEETVPAPPDVALRLDPAWARYAPLTSSGVVAFAAILGVGSQLFDSLGGGPGVEVQTPVSGVGPSWWVLLVAIPVVAAVISVLAVAGYLVSNWGLILTHAARDGSWHLRRGLFTTRETSLDDERLTGVSIGEPVGLRLARGARLSAIVTGLDRRQSGGSMLVPPAPRAVVTGVAGRVLGSDEPVTGPLRSHGARARARRFSRALVPTLLLSLALGLAVVSGAPPGLLVLAVALPSAALALAADRARALGHALTAGHFVVRSGSLFRQRQALETTAVIGWNFRSTWFQRRAGLTTLRATTAGGSQAVTALDVPEPDAVAVSCAAVPGLVDQFLAPD